MKQAISSEDFNKAMALMCEPDDEVKRKDLEGFLHSGGTVKASITERGIRSKALLDHKSEHGDCNESCPELVKLQAERDKFKGPEIEYERLDFDIQRKERLSLVTLWVIASVMRLRAKSYIEVGNFIFEDVTTAGLKRIAGFTPTREEAKAILNVISKVDNETLESMLDLAFAEPPFVAT